MDSGLVIFVPLMFVGGLGISLVLRLLVQSWWLAASVGALLPPSLLLVADVIGSGGAYAPDIGTVAAVLIIWAAAFVPALLGALCGIFVGARLKRRQKF